MKSHKLLYPVCLAIASTINAMDNITMQIVNKAEERISIEVHDGMTATLDNTTLTIIPSDNTGIHTSYYLDDIRYFNYIIPIESGIAEVPDNIINVKFAPDNLTLYSPDHDIIQYSIVDMAGTIIEQNTLPTTDNPTIIDTSSYRPGIYIILLNNRHCIKFTRI